MLQPEKMVLDMMQLNSLSDLSGYKELWVMLEDMDQKLTVEA